MDTKNTKKLNIVIPMAGGGRKFQEAGYAFPKPLIDMHGKTMIEVVTHNVKPTEDHTFIFICQREHYTKYDLHNILKNATNNKFEVVLSLANKNKGMIFGWFYIMSHHFDHCLSMHIDKWLRESVPSFLKFSPSSCHRDDNV
jgi:NDP-sugar pyrophosphorylase family protein